jgi:hypothetical protein
VRGPAEELEEQNSRHERLTRRRDGGGDGRPWAVGEPRRLGGQRRVVHRTGNDWEPAVAADQRAVRIPTIARR